MPSKLPASAAARLNSNLPIVLVFVIGLASILTAGPGLYAIGSWFLYPFDQWVEAFDKELSSGVMALRITSMVLLFRLIVDLLPAKTVNRLISIFVRHNSTATSLQAMQVLTEHRSPFAINITHYSQVFYFNLALGVMWLMQIQGYSSGAAYKLLSLVLLFIVDDWAIISAWMRESKGRIMKMHQFMVLGCNVLILLLIAAVTIPTLQSMAVIPIGLGFWLLKWRYTAAIFFGDRTEAEANDDFLEGSAQEVLDERGTIHEQTAIEPRTHPTSGLAATHTFEHVGGGNADIISVELLKRDR